MFHPCYLYSGVRANLAPPACCNITLAGWPASISLGGGLKAIIFEECEKCLGSVGLDHVCVNSARLWGEGWRVCFHSWQAKGEKVEREIDARYLVNSCTYFLMMFWPAIRMSRPGRVGSVGRRRVQTDPLDPCRKKVGAAAPTVRTITSLLCDCHALPCNHNQGTNL